MPGQNYENLMRAVNANPEPHLRLYLTSQLVPYFSELYYIARKLKNLKVINRYNLDNNGNTHIALAEHLMAFKFTGLDQLRQLNVSVPNILVEEIGRSAVQISQNQTRAANLNLQKASQPRSREPEGGRLSREDERPCLAWWGLVWFGLDLWSSKLRICRGDLLSRAWGWRLGEGKLGLLW